MKGCCTALLCILGMSAPPKYPEHAERKVGNVISAEDARCARQACRGAQFDKGEWVAVELSPKKRELRYAQVVIPPVDRGDLYVTIRVLSEGGEKEQTFYRSSCSLKKFYSDEERRTSLDIP